MDLQGKKVAVLGCGTSGFCAARLAVSKGAIVTTYQTGMLHYKRKALADQTPVEKLDSNLKKLHDVVPRMLSPSSP